MASKKYDSTVARIAGNIAGSYVKGNADDPDDETVAEWSVSLARAIVAKVIQTEPKDTE